MKRLLITLVAAILCHAADAELVGQRWAVKGAGGTMKAVPSGELTRLAPDLSTLPRGAKIYRADLLIGLTKPVDGQMDEAAVDIEICPVFAEVKEGDACRAAGAPLTVRGPWFDALDATEAVRAWAEGKPNGGFLVKACPLLSADATYLDVLYEGTAANPPQQVTGLQAFHRSGQTFITWKETSDPVGRDEIAWGELKPIMDKADGQGRLRFCVFRSEKPITAATLSSAELIARVKPLSCWNVNGRNIERPIDQVIATQDVLLCGQWNPFQSASTEGAYGKDCPIDRLAIKDGDKPLPRGTGLYVHAAAGKAKAYYAVLACVNGVLSAAGVSGENSAGPVDESPAEPEPVLQGELPKMPFFNYADKRLHYVVWQGPPCANIPSQYYNWSVAVPEKLSAAAEQAVSKPVPPVPLELNLHRDGDSYWRTQFRLERNSIVCSPYDFPFRTWWYGYSDSYGTLKSFKTGIIQPFTERRLLAFIEWACRKWPVDRNKIVAAGCRNSTGGTGALHLALRHPDVFCLVVSGHGMVEYNEAVKNADDKNYGWMAGSLQSVFGKLEWDLKTDTGRSVWEEHNMIKRVAALPPAAELPLVAMTSKQHADPVREFYKVMLEAGRPIIAEFSWGGGRYIPVTASETFQNAVRLDVRKDLSMAALRTEAALKLISAPTMGEFDRDFLWRDPLDETSKYELTLYTNGRSDLAGDVTLRRLQKFKVEPGKTYHWQAKDLKPSGATPSKAVGKKDLAPPAPAEGDVTIGPDGILTIKGIRIPRDGARLVVAPKQ